MHKNIIETVQYAYDYALKYLPQFDAYMNVKRGWWMKIESLKDIAKRSNDVYTNVLERFSNA